MLRAARMGTQWVVAAARSRWLRHLRDTGLVADTVVGTLDAQKVRGSRCPSTKQDASTERRPISLDRDFHTPNSRQVGILFSLDLVLNNIPNELKNINNKE